jgi:hypothetical protein
MSDQSLREALEKRLEGLPVVAYENGYRSQALPKVELLALLAVHPGDELDPDSAEFNPADWVEVLRPTEDEPARFGATLADIAAVQPSNAAVEAAGEALWMQVFNGVPWQEAEASEREDCMRTTRAALQAAYRVDVPRPLLDRMAVRDVLVRFWNAVLCNSDVPGWTVQQEAEKARDAVMELARPMPTREQIDRLLTLHYYDAKWSQEHQGFRCVCHWLGDDHVQHVRDELLALLNGAGS